MNRECFDERNESEIEVTNDNRSKRRYNIDIDVYRKNALMNDTLDIGDTIELITSDIRTTNETIYNYNTLIIYIICRKQTIDRRKGLQTIPVENEINLSDRSHIHSQKLDLYERN